MNRTRYLIRVTVVVVLSAATVGGWYLYHAIWAPNIPNSVESYDLYIPADSPFDSVVAQLRSKRVLRSVRTFRFVARYKKYDRKIKSGRYRLYGGMSNNEVVNLLRSGEQTPVQVTFNNIDHIYELAGVVSRQLEADSSEMIGLLADPVYLDSRNLARETVLGIFLPNTYEVYWNTSAEAFIERMLYEYRAYWNEERREASAQLGMTPHEVSTLASIVERETVKPDEMRRVAGLYINRLRKGWKLQSDPTVIFALRQLNPDTMIRRVLIKDLQIQSPYNTYLREGLPPGPIGAPCLDAIEAVLEPEYHKYMYMCASVDRPGYHEFATNLMAHNRHAARYRQWLNRQRLYR